jgi:hypothetical protein
MPDGRDAQNTLAWTRAKAPNWLTISRKATLFSQPDRGRIQAPLNAPKCIRHSQRRCLPKIICLRIIIVVTDMPLAEGS